MSSTKLTKRLFTDIARLKLLDIDTATPRFRVQSTPFDDEDDEASNKNQDEYVIIGQIFPNSELYNKRSYSIEMRLTKTYPIEPPIVRFLTPIYHPNVGRDGTFCTELLQKTHKWTPVTSLIEVVKSVTDHIDHPDVNSTPSVDLGMEYVQNRDEFNRKALEYVEKHGLPR